MTTVSSSSQPVSGRLVEKTSSAISFMNDNRSFAIGVAMILVVLFIAYIMPFFIEADDARVGAVKARLSPTAEHFMGTDTQGRDVLSVFVLSISQTLKIAVVAGGIGTLAGLLLGLIAGYFRGPLDAVIRFASDVMITIPAIIILVIVSANIREMTVEIMAIIIALVSWMGAMRTIRAQVLTLRERSYIQIAQLNGESGFEVLIREVLPNLMPYLVARFVMAVSVAVLATIGLEALGLGPQNSYTLGMMVYWSQLYNAVLRGMWWWWSPPIAMIVWIFLGLYLISTGVDKIANPRLRNRNS
jgi:peptide/nickel transport system permease protein